MVFVDAYEQKFVMTNTDASASPWIYSLISASRVVPAESSSSWPFVGPLRSITACAEMHLSW